MPLLLFRDAAQNVDSVVCIHVKRHQSAGRWIIFGGICTFCNMLMSKAAKARLPGERRGDGGSKKREGAAWKRGKQTEAGVNYGCNLQFPRGKERQRETSSHAYQIAHLPHFLSMVHEQTRIQSGPSVRVCVRLRMSESAFTHPSMSSCVELRGAVKLSPSPDMTRLFSAVWTFAAPLDRAALHCVSQRAAAVTWLVTLHTYRFSPLHAQGHTGVTVLRGGIT